VRRPFISVDPATYSFDVAFSGPGDYAQSRAYLCHFGAAAGLDHLEMRIMNHRMMPWFRGAFQVPD